MTGAPFGAEQALAWGLVNRLCAPDNLMDEVLAIADNAPLSVRKGERATTLGARTDLRFAMFFETDPYNRLAGTLDRREGIRAFKVKLTQSSRGDDGKRR